MGKGKNQQIWQLDCTKPTASQPSTTMKNKQKWSLSLLTQCRLCETYCDPRFESITSTDCFKGTYAWTANNYADYNCLETCAIKHGWLNLWQHILGLLELLLLFWICEATVPTWCRRLDLRLANTQMSWRTAMWTQRKSRDRKMSRTAIPEEDLGYELSVLTCYAHVDLLAILWHWCPHMSM